MSVIIPVYNGEKYLRRAIESVVNQTYTGKYELLLIDDGSTDGTATICMEYVLKHPFVHYYYHANMGIFKTRERAAELTCGEYLCWVDSDDYVSPDLLKVAMEKIEETGADICIYSWQGIRQNGDKGNHIRENYTSEEWRKRMLMGEVCTVWSYISKRKLWKKEQMPWQVKLRGEDIIKTISIFNKAHIITSVPSVLYYYTVDNPGSLTHTYSGLELVGAGYALYQLFKISSVEYPDVAANVGLGALKTLIKTYCISSYLDDLTTEQKEEIRSYILEITDKLEQIHFRFAYRIFLIRYRLDWIIKIVGKLGLRKMERNN